MARVGERARELGGGAEPVIEIQQWYPDGSPPVEIADFSSVNPVASLEYRVLAEVPNGVGLGPSADFEVLTIPAHRAVQVMHRGPFAEEFGTLARLGEFARAQGVRRTGPHHELHLDAFTRSTPQEGLRTILRDPVSRPGALQRPASRFDADEHAALEATGRAPREASLRRGVAGARARSPRC